MLEGEEKKNRNQIIWLLDFLYIGILKKDSA